MKKKDEMPVATSLEPRIPAPSKIVAFDPPSKIVAFDPTGEFDADLAGIQERILAAAMDRGHDGTTWPLYELVVALRRYIGEGYVEGAS